MSDRHLIVGAGPVGTQLAALLAARGSEVVVATRSGTDTGVAGVRHERVDASDAEALSRLAEGADVLYNCANPTDYTQWAIVWPPLAASLLTAAERTGAVLAITGNLYPYGPVEGPMVESLPDAATDAKGRLRARMWADARDAHVAGRLRAVEVRGSDYVGPGVGANGHISRVLPKAMKGRRAWVIGSPDLPHTFTDVLDMGRALVAAAADETAHGQVWHAPSNPAITQRQALTDVLAAAGRPKVAVSGIPTAAMALTARFSGMVRELRELSYQWTRPYVLDDAVSREKLGLEPTPWDEVCARAARV